MLLVVTHDPRTMTLVRIIIIIIIITNIFLTSTNNSKYSAKITKTMITNVPYEKIFR